MEWNLDWLLLLWCFLDVSGSNVRGSLRMSVAWDLRSSFDKDVLDFEKFIPNDFD